MRLKHNRSYPLPLPRKLNSRTGSPQDAFTLVEVVVGAFVLLLMLVSLYSAFVSGLAVLRVTRENLRATQILEERMEVVRLIKWDDVAPGFIPTEFIAPYDATKGTNIPAEGFAYYGTVTITNVPMTEKYADDLRMIQVELTWKSANIWRKRQMTTYVSRYGVQNYIY